MKVDMLKVAVQDRGANDGSEVEKYELGRDDDLRIEVHECAIEVSDLEDTSAKEDNDERVCNPFFENPDEFE